MNLLSNPDFKHIPWNKGKITGQKPALKLKEIWAIRIRLQLQRKIRDLAMFNLALDSKLRGCDLISLKVRDISHGSAINKRAVILQKKTHEPVQFELTEQTRDAVLDWINYAKLKYDNYLFPSHWKIGYPITTRQYARIVKAWVMQIGLDPMEYGTHSLRRTKASLLYKKTKNLRAIQLLLGHKSLESTVKYLGIEVDDALEMAENMDI